MLQSEADLGCHIDHVTCCVYPQRCLMVSRFVEPLHDFVFEFQPLFPHLVQFAFMGAGRSFKQSLNDLAGRMVIIHEF